MARIKINLSRLLLPKQAEIWRNMRRFTVVAAGRRFGKTRFAVLYMFVQALRKRGVYWWVAPTYKIMLPAWRLMRYLAWTIGARINKTERVIELRNGSFIEFRSGDDPQSLVGEGLSGLVVDEAGKVNLELAWNESLRPALADNLGWAIFIGTPKGKNTFYELYKLGEPGPDQRPDWASFTFTSYDNPRVAASEIDAARDLLPEIVFSQEFLAMFVQAEGSVFKREHYENRRALAEYEFVATYISADTAQSVAGGSSFTSILLAGLTAKYKLVPIYVHRRRLEFPQLQSALEEVARMPIAGLDKRLLKGIIVETKSAGLSLVQNMRKTADPEIANLIRPFNPTTTGSVRIDDLTGVSQRKLIAALEASVWGEKGMLHLPAPDSDLPWLHEFEEELFDFPSSVYNDQVDSLSQLVHYLQNYLTEGYRAGQRKPELTAAGGEYGR